MAKPREQKRSRAKIVAIVVVAVIAGLVFVVTFGVVLPALREAEAERALEEAKATAQEAKRGPSEFRVWYHDPDDPLGGLYIVEDPAPPNRKTRTEAKPSHRQDERPVPTGAHPDDPLTDVFRGL